ncbi:2'-5' RNA ligase family protein [Kaistia sp. UC242_56]|uniref:2'-5' RNA ligase family protein n=1 Tax=Kaistia sp. UC242_56 TaxID=3374625 RepID=UPI00378D9A0F
MSGSDVLFEMKFRGNPVLDSAKTVGTEWKSLALRKTGRMRRSLNLMAAFITSFALLAGSAVAQENPVTAIDIALEPDAAMLQHAEATNARLRAAFPEGYALDATHRPHITILQRFVDTAALDEVYAAVGAVLAAENPAEWTLKTLKYDFIVSDQTGVTALLVEPTDQLIRFQQKLIDAVAPFTVETGTTAAFFTTAEEPDINQPTIDYVNRYVPHSSGKKFMPHVTVGVAPPDYLQKMIAEPFDAFTFSPAALSVYQLGNFGTARNKLQAWQLKP